MKKTFSSTSWLRFEAISKGARARLREPDREGLTMVIDTGLGVAQTTDIVGIAAANIDHWKLGFGTAAITPSNILQQKLELLDSQGILTYPGGTLFESIIIHDKGRDYFAQLKKIGFAAVEISNGTIHLDRVRRRSFINEAREMGLVVIAEAGCKDPQRQLPVSATLEQIQSDFEAGAEWVIIEGRECGAGIGIYDNSGNIRKDLLLELVSGLRRHLSKIIWEAPKKNQQYELIHHLGANVNLGNIDATQCLSLEALRRGLRFETLQHIANECCAENVLGSDMLIRQRGVANSDSEHFQLKKIKASKVF